MLRSPPDFCEAPLEEGAMFARTPEVCSGVRRREPVVGR